MRARVEGSHATLRAQQAAYEELSASLDGRRGVSLASTRKRHCNVHHNRAGPGSPGPRVRSAFAAACELGDLAVGAPGPTAHCTTCAVLSERRPWLSAFARRRKCVASSASDRHWQSRRTSSACRP